MKDLSIFFIFLFLLFSLPVFPQADGYNIRYFTKEDGLSHNHTGHIMQDSKGFLWVGSQYGLNKFDGTKFKIYTKRKNGLANNFTSHIHEDQNGYIWLRYDGWGNDYCPRESLFSIFDPKKEKAISFDEFFPDAPFKMTDIRLMDTDSQKNMWIVTYQGELYKYDNSFTLIHQKLEWDKAMSLHIIPNKEFWIVYYLEDSKTNIQKWSANGELKKEIKIDAKIVSNVAPLNEKSFCIKRLGTQHSTFLCLDWEGNQLDYNYEIDPKSQIGYHRPFVFNQPDGEVEVWHAGIKKLSQTDTNGNLIKDFSDQLFFLDGKDYVTNFIFLDRSNNFWVSSNKGLALLSPKRELFRTVLKNEDNSINSMRAILDWDDKNILACSYKGFFKIEKQNLLVSQIILKEKERKNNPSASLYGVGGLTKGDSILLGVHGPNFLIIDKEKLTSELVFLDNRCNDNRFFFKDSKNQFWLSSEDGLFPYDFEKMKIAILAPLGSEDGLINSPINFIYEEKDHLLICSDKGLFSINHQGKIEEIFKDFEGFQVNYLFKKGKNQYWLATKGNGLIFWNRGEGVVKQFSKENGLSHDYIYSIHEDEFGYFWLPSNDGLMRFNPKDYSVNIFMEKDGIANNEFNTYSNYVADDGRIFLGGLNGVTIFDPKDFQYLDEQRIPLKVVSAQKLESDGKFSTISEEDFLQKEIRFSSTDKALTLEFSLLDYINSFQSKYAYKIENYDSDWNYLPANKLRINKPPYGKYTLKVKAQGSNGTWSKEVLSIPLIVKRPLHLTWQFITSMVLLLIYFLYKIAKWRIKSLEKDKLKLEAIVAERTQKLTHLNELKNQFFGIIAHDLKNPMLSFRNISQKVEYFKKRGSDDDTKRFLEGLDKTAENVNVLLDNLLKWSMVEQESFPYHPQMISVGNSIEENISLFEELASQKNILIKNKIPEDLNIFADKNSMTTVFRNILSNAIKFSEENGEIQVHAIREDEKLKISVKDAGVGMSQERLDKVFDLKNKQSSSGTNGEKGSGLGLVLCKKLVELNQGEINIQSNQGNGTVVTIQFDKKLLKRV